MLSQIGRTSRRGASSVVNIYMDDSPEAVSLIKMMSLANRYDQDQRMQSHHSLFQGFIIINFKRHQIAVASRVQVLVSSATKISR